MGEQQHEPVDPAPETQAAATGQAGSDPGAGMDISGMFAQAQQLQDHLVAAQRALEAEEVTGTAGGGLVTALMSGTGELISLTIARSAVDPDDTETLSDLIVAAVRDASQNAKELAAASMGPLAQGLGIPGLDGPGGVTGLPGQG